jgi:hypothetical protein
MDGLILDFLIRNIARITYEDKWLVVNNIDGIIFTVYQRGYNQKYTRTLYDGDNLKEALSALQGECGGEG